MTRRRRRRSWSDAEKREICRQTRVPGVSVSQVARRYDVNASQVFNWLRAPRFAPESVEPERSEPVFLPVEIIPDGAPAINARPSDHPTVDEPTIEITLSGGGHVAIRGSFNPEAVARLSRGSSRELRRVPYLPASARLTDVRL